MNLIVSTSSHNHTLSRTPPPLPPPPPHTQGIENSCCGMMFNSRGCKDAAAAKAAELEAAIYEASEGGKLPVVVDTSPCLMQIKQQLSEPNLRCVWCVCWVCVGCGCVLGVCWVNAYAYKEKSATDTNYVMILHHATPYPSYLTSHPTHSTPHNTQQVCSV